MTEENKKSYLVEMEIKDVHKYYSNDDAKRGKVYEINASFVLNGRKCEIKDVSLAEDVAAQIMRIIETAAFGEIKMAVENTALMLEANHQDKLAIAAGKTVDGESKKENDDILY